MSSLRSYDVGNRFLLLICLDEFDAFSLTTIGRVAKGIEFLETEEGMVVPGAGTTTCCTA
jgi:hypothetical protein